MSSWNCFNNPAQVEKDNIMKALTIWQPYATLIAMGYKQYETRSWGTDYRGLLAIHAAKNQNEFHYIMQEYPNTLRGILAGAGYQPPYDIPFGAVIAIAKLVDCIPSEELIKTINNDEEFWGDFSPGRYGWQLEIIERLEPIPARGQQGLWEWVRPLSTPGNEQLKLF